jgi:hypothetical protein
VNRRHRRLYRIVFAILCGTGLLLISDAVTERSMTHTALCVMWNLGLVLGVVWYRRAACHRGEAITFDTVRPCGAVGGFLIARLTGFGASPNAIALSSQVHLIRTGAAVAALIAMVAIGLTVARDRRLQIQELSEKLKAIQEDT